MPKHVVRRTLVKSPPELWEVCSDAESLSRHLQPFGEIRITRLEPETTVAWEGERASGTVEIEPSGWGTRVILTAQAPEPAHAPAPVPPPPPVAPPEPQVPDAGVVREPPAPPVPPVSVIEVRKRRGLFGRLARGLLSSAVAPVIVGGEEPEISIPPAALPPVPEVPVVVAAEPQPTGPPDALEPPVALDAPAALEVPDVLDAPAALGAALDSLGQDHHRPFSRG